MSKGNLFLGFATGKVGDVVFTRSDGEQIARGRNRSPRNPRTPSQLLQRVCLKTSSAAFSLFRDICDHSFQSVNGATMNQARFNKINIALMREQLADYIGTGDDEDIMTCQEANFLGNNSTGVAIRPYIVSEGSISAIEAVWLPALDGLHSFSFFGVPTKKTGLTGTNLTYQDMCDILGVQRGDQLTFLLCSCDDRADVFTSYFNGFHYARVIMEPSGGDMTTVFLDSSTGLINQPNERNEGDIRISTVATNAGGGMEVQAATISYPGFSNNAELENSVCACAVIVSRSNGGVWQRSNASLVLRPDYGSVAGKLRYDHSELYLADAVYSYMSGNSSTKYLNQAENF